MNANFQPYEGTEPYIFISYARKDGMRARSLLEALHRAGYRVWYDSGIQAGKKWADSLAEHILGCKVFMPLVSFAFADSLNCYDETTYARKKKREILPVYLEEEVSLPPGLDIALYEAQWLKLSDYQDADAFALTLDAEPGCAPCRNAPGTIAREAS